MKGGHCSAIWLWYGGSRTSKLKGFQKQESDHSLFVIYWEREVFKHFKHAEGSTVIFF